jgi:hypothetical protein
MSKLTLLLKIKMFPVAMFFAVIAIYLAAVDNIMWLYWVAFGIILFERIALQAKLIFAQYVIKKMQTELLNQLAEQMNPQNPPLFGSENPPIK